MNPASFRVHALTQTQDRRTFCSGSAPLDRYFQTQITQDIKRRVTACFVATTQTGRIAGFYTLAAASVLLTDLPASVAKKLPRYPSVPSVRMGRLAIDLEFKGQGLGAAMLADALLRAAHAEIAALALLGDAKDASAADFYKHHRFAALPDQPRTLFIALAPVQSL
ncbi:MAG: N-acetyltransferase [Betaproteobacteria bacterium]|nr:N-acetyltransferase [Betaproteobacteria bacterium]MSQ89099.1 N-acetyltransferase [Betaproteobacteria bacterium]